MTKHDIVVIGASAGGVESLQKLLRGQKIFLHPYLLFSNRNCLYPSPNRVQDQTEALHPSMR